MGSFVTTRRKNWERITTLGAFGVISEIQRAKFGVFVTYIFGGKIWGQAPRPPNMEVPPLGLLTGVRILPVAYLSLSDRIANPGKIFANVAFDRRL